MKNKLSKIIGNEIKKHRQNKGWSQNRLAREMNVNQPAISKWENGDTTLNSQAFIKLAKLLCFDLNNIQKQAEAICP